MLFDIVGDAMFDGGRQKEEFFTIEKQRQKNPVLHNLQ